MTKTKKPQLKTEQTVPSAISRPRSRRAPTGLAQRLEAGAGATDPEKRKDAPCVDQAPADLDTQIDVKPAQGPKSKQASLIDLLKRDGGATLKDMMAATGWQKHSVRGLIAGTLKKKLGLVVSSEVKPGRGRIYHITSQPMSGEA